MFGSRAAVGFRWDRATFSKEVGRTTRGAAMVSAVVLLAGCSIFRGVNLAPVEDRSTSRSAPVAVEASAPAARLPPGSENAGKPDYYTVKPGDTMIRIGLDTGQNWRDIARWSGIENPNQIEVGQVLRIAPPVSGTILATAPVSGAVTKPVVAAIATPTPVPPVVAANTAKPAVAAASSPATAASAPVAAPIAPAASAPASNGDDDIAWIWPTNGGVLAGFDEVKNKGLDIGGIAGESVVAAADGRVVYVGAGLRGYGNLIILKHNNTYLTAYAHNQTLLVKEDQSVRRGQKIAEMGNSDADRVKLHFEVRRQGKPVDPAKYLPPR
jgi:lipoprotein NlpD